MTTDEQRQILYAALLRYSPETGSLRERALDRFVLAALLGSSRSEPMTIEVVQQLTVLVPNSPGLRTDVIDDILARLTRSNRVDLVETSTGDRYFLTDLGRQHTDEAAESAAHLFRPVLDRMLRDTAGVFSPDVGEVVCRTFISECFARFGHQIAKAVTGDLEDDGSFGGADINGAFDAAIQDISLSEEAIRTLRARCNRFLRSMEPDDKDLRFRLAQSYYVVQLLELSPQDFNPLADDAFSGAVFFLDTNVVFDAVMSEDSSRRFRELVRASGSLGIELQVTVATLDEAISVASLRVEAIEKIVDTLPEEFLARTNDDFILAFRAARAVQPNITPTEFLAPFEQLPSLLRDLGIAIDDRHADEIAGAKDLAQECQIVSHAAEKHRGWPKNSAVSLHDVCHFFLVREQRQAGKKAWFLTRDHTLSHAAVQLAPGELPFCFPLVAFLQSVSPFLETPAARHSLVDVFSAVLDGEVADLSGSHLFDITELRLISELHTDVLSLPKEELVPAFDYVKSNLLKGRPYRREDHTEVALELKKFLTSSARDKQEALLAELEEQKCLVASSQDKLTNAEKEAGRMRNRIDRLNQQVADANEREASRVRNHKLLSSGLALIGVVLASVCWWFDLGLIRSIANVLPHGALPVIPLAFVARAVGAVVFVASLIPALSYVPKGTYRNCGYTIVVAVAVGASDLVGLPTLKAISTYLAVAAPFALMIAFALGASRDDRQTRQ